VDIPESLAAVLLEWAAGKQGYLFATDTGKPLGQRNVLSVLHSAKKVGFHAFRRFRTERLRQAGVPEDLLRLWIGHEAESITDLYADGLKKDAAWRREWAAKVGLGFSMNGLRWATNVVPITSAKVA
jgi:integrase